MSSGMRHAVEAGMLHAGTPAAGARCGRCGGEVGVSDVLCEACRGFFRMMARGLAAAPPRGPASRADA